MEQLSFGDAAVSTRAPLADRMRPQRLSEVIGQPQLTGPNTFVGRAVAEKTGFSLVVHGSPGTGKTTIALAIARELGLAFEQLNAVTDGVGDLREVIKRAKGRHGLGEQTLLFVDEIARWSKAQQDALLPFVEDGTVMLFGATTENPAFELNQALRSRVRIERVHKLGDDDAERVVRRAMEHPDGLNEAYAVTDEAMAALIRHADGDARALLTGLEYAALLGREAGLIGQPEVERALGERQYAGRTEHYHLASALIKSIRGSDPDAAMYWLARMEAAGEEPRFVARRLLIAASEEVGMAQPGAITVAQSTFDAVHSLGAPECWIPMASLTCYLATCPKNWAAYEAMHAAREIVASEPAYPVPLHLQNPSDEVSRAEGAGEGYVHASQPGAERLEFFPTELGRARPYTKGLTGNEQHRSWSRVE